MSHVLLNESHDHSSPALPGYYAGRGTSPTSRTSTSQILRRGVVEAAVEADARAAARPIGCGWGESRIGVYRRELRDGRWVLGEVPDHPIDSSVGVIRVDDLDGRPIAVVFRYSAHPVTVGGRAAVASSDYPGAARDVLERNLGGVALFLQGCGGNINPRVGIGYEIDCRDTKKRVGMELGGEALQGRGPDPHQHEGGRAAAARQRPQHPLHPLGAGRGTPGPHLAALERPSPSTTSRSPRTSAASAIAEHWRTTLAERVDRGAQEWEIRVAVKMERWAKRLLAAVEAGGATFDLDLQAIRISDIVIAGMNVETFFETGLAIRDRSPLPDTFVLGYTNGSMAYLPRAEDHPEGGWKLGERYALPDQLPQFYPRPGDRTAPRLGAARDRGDRRTDSATDLRRGGGRWERRCYAGAARRAINPLLGTGKGGPAALRLADPGDRERPDGDGARARRRRHQGRADRDRPLRDEHGRGRTAAGRRRGGDRNPGLARAPQPEPQPQLAGAARASWR